MPFEEPLQYHRQGDNGTVKFRVVGDPPADLCAPMSIIHERYRGDGVRLVRGQNGQESYGGRGGFSLDPLLGLDVPTGLEDTVVEELNVWGAVDFTPQ